MRPTTPAPDTASGAPESAAHATTDNLGFLLAKASARWNELLAQAFADAGFADVRPSYGSVLLPLFEQDGLRMGELCDRARLTKQTMTTLIAQMESAGLVRREPDPGDGRARLVFLTPRSLEFKPAAERILAGLEARVQEHLDQRTRNAMKRGLTGVMNV